MKTKTRKKRVVRIDRTHSRPNKPARKRPLNNKGTKRSPSGRHSFANTKLAKELKKHNLSMPHGYETKLRIYRIKSNKAI